MVGLKVRGEGLLLGQYILGLLKMAMGQLKIPLQGNS